MVTVSDKVEEGDQLPPAYTESTGSDVPPPPINEPSSSSLPSPFASTPPLSQATNFLTISRANSSIKGGYTIDPSMPKPPGVDPSIDGDGKPLNMHVLATNGAVDVVIELSRSGDVKGPARLKAESRNGSVTVTVHDKRPNRFRLHAISMNGAVTVHLPSTYVGTVSTGVKNGDLKFGPAVHKRLVTFSETNKEARFFIGDYVSSGYQDDETWFGDHLRIESYNGRVKVDFIDEESEASSRGKGSSNGKGFFSRMLS